MSKRIKTTVLITALTTILGGHMALAQAISVAQTLSTPQTNAYIQLASNNGLVRSVIGALTTVKVDGYTYSQEVVEGLEYYNRIRKEAGLDPVTLNPYLTKAAENHANYLSMNKTTGHSEDSAKPGFTGKSSFDRVTAVAPANTFSASHIIENISYGEKTIQTGISILLNAPYHRLSLLDSSVTEIGVSFTSNQLVIELNCSKSSSGTTIYPLNKQTSVPVAFKGENPDPLEGTGLKKAGHIITYNTTKETKDITVSLKNSKGEAVPFIVKEGTPPYYWKNRKAWLIIPKNYLEYKETYTVTADNTTWSFTTEDVAPRVFTVKDVGVLINGFFKDLTPRAQIVDGSTMIPLRGVFESLGAKIGWDGDKQQVIIEKGTTKIILTLDSKTAIFNGKQVALEVAPFLLGDSTFVPLRFASEALGAKVEWNQTKYIASITLN